MMNVSFLGLRRNISLGKKAIREVERDYPHGLKSSTYYQTFSPHVSGRVLSELEESIAEMREITDHRLRLGNTKQEAIEYAVQKTGAANCGEQAFLVRKKLQDRGIPNKIIRMEVYKNGLFSSRVTDSHAFCVIDTDSRMDVKDPETWGKNAVVVDMWSNVVSSVQDALDYFSTFIKPKKNEVLNFSEEFYI